MGCNGGLERCLEVVYSKGGLDWIVLIFKLVCTFWTGLL